MTDQDMPAVPANGAADEAAMRDWAELLVARARAEGVELTGDGGLLTGWCAKCCSAAWSSRWPSILDMSATLWRAAGRATRATQATPKTVTTEVGRVDLRVPRDRAGTFEPVTVPKHQRRLGGLSQNVISLYAKGLTTGEIQAHLEEIYDTEVSRETISKITDGIVADMAAWQNRPLDAPHPGPHRLHAVAELTRHPLNGAMIGAPLGAQLANQPHRLGLLLHRVPPRRRTTRQLLCRHSHILAFPSSGTSGKARVPLCVVKRLGGRWCRGGWVVVRRRA